MPVVSRLVGVGQRDAAGPPGNSTGNTSANAAWCLRTRPRKIDLHPLVELLDDREQVLAGLREVGELLGEELVPLLERRELLEGERVHPPELGQLALGVLQSPLLLSRTVRRRGSAPRPSGRRARNRLVRAVLRNENVFGRGRARDRPARRRPRRGVASRGCCSSRPCTLSVRPAGARARGLLASQLARSSLVTAVRAASARASSTRACADRAVDRVEHRGQLRRRPRAAASRCARRIDGAARGLRRRLPFALALPLQLHDPRLAGADPLLARSRRRSRASISAVARRLERREHAVARRRVEHRPRRARAASSAVLRVGARPLAPRRRAASACATARREPLAVGDRRPRACTVRPVDLLGARGQRGVVTRAASRARLRPGCLRAARRSASGSAAESALDAPASRRGARPRHPARRRARCGSPLPRCRRGRRSGRRPRRRG